MTRACGHVCARFWVCRTTSVTPLRDTQPASLLHGGLGLRSAVRTSLPAHWASWGDCLSMIKNRHPEVAHMIVTAVENHPRTPNLEAVARAKVAITGVHGFEPPDWRSLATGLRPKPRDPKEHEPVCRRQGWQHEASVPCEWEFRERRIMYTMTATERVLLRSQSGPGAEVAFSEAPSNFHIRIESHLFRVLLQRRLRLRLPPSSRFCRCGRPFDAFGHHRAACLRTGELGRRGFALESAGAGMCREAGGRVATNVIVCDLDIAAPDPRDGRRLEIVVDRLPLFGGVQVAVDTTLVSPLHCDGSPTPGAGDTDGAALIRARRRKERTYPELVQPRARARLVVLAGEGGRWSAETRQFIGLLARAQSRNETRLMRRRVEQAWRLRWWAMLSCAAARAFAASLLGMRSSRGSDGVSPLSDEVVHDHRYAGLG